MIGRKSAKHIALLADRIFSKSTGVGQDRWVPWDPVYDFLYQEDFDPAFCNAAKRAAYNGHRPFIEFILKLHTGESVPITATTDDLATRSAQGQAYLRQFAEALVRLTLKVEEEVKKREYAAAPGKASWADALLRSLELDGYVFREGKLLHVESALIDVEKQHSALLELAKDLQLANLEALSKFLDLTEQHYSAGRWEDCIANGRKFLEGCLQEAATKYSKNVVGTPHSPEIFDKPVKVREFLQEQGLLSEREARAIAETYGVLSQIGNHPKMAASDHARVLRQVALLFSEFVLLRAKSAMKS